MSSSNRKGVLEELWRTIIKTFKMLRFFKFSWIFFPKLNIQPEELYTACLDSDIKFLSCNLFKKRLYFIYKDKYYLVTNYSVATIVQIFTYKPYQLPSSQKKYIVFDVGMNKGFSSMWFAMHSSVQRVIGYEVNADLLELIMENREMNKKLFKKIEFHGFGLAGSSRKIMIHSLTNDDGVTTINDQFYNKYWSKERKAKGIEKIAYVKKASKQIEKYMKRNTNKSYVLKIDVEGAEYEIFNDLQKNKLLDRFDIIMGETHLGFDCIKKQLRKFDIVQLETFDNNLNTFLAYRNKYED